MFTNWQWNRDPNNPILAPVADSSYDCTRCSMPFVIRVGDEYRMYYAGADAQGTHRICLATADVDRPLEFKRRGVVLDVGEKDAFDAYWCVVARVYRVGNRWHMYYTGRDHSDRGLQSFGGIGLAVSDDGLNFTRYSRDPIVQGNQTAMFPDNRAAAGGVLLTETADDGLPAYRLYYTLPVGTKNVDPRIDQEKHGAVCHGRDGIHWTDHRVVLSPRRDVPKEDIASTMSCVWCDGSLYRLLYSGIGTRWGYYSISEAYSHDGYDWHRGQGDENLALAPDPASAWESEMVEYPCLLRENGVNRLFYCGNGYGNTGIGTAVVCGF